MKNLQNLSKEDVLDFVRSFEYVVFDIDGVLQYSKSTIPGADRCVHNLRKLSKKLAIVSNNTITDRKMLVEGLKDFEVVDEELVSPNEVLLSYLKKIKFEKDIYVIGGRNPKQLLRQEGYNVVEIEPKTTEDSAVALKNDCLEIIKKYTNIGAVVVDVDLNFTLLHAHRAINLLNHYKDIILLCGAGDESGPVAKGVMMLGPKFYVDAVKRLGNREGLSYAKPSQLLGDYLTKKCSILDPNKVLFVGDNLGIDVMFGHNSGYQTLLVLSGQTQAEDITNWKEETGFLKPDFYVNSLNEFNDLLVKHCIE